MRKGRSSSSFAPGSVTAVGRRGGGGKILILGFFRLSPRPPPPFLTLAAWRERGEELSHLQGRFSASSLSLEKRKKAAGDESCNSESGWKEGEGEERKERKRPNVFVGGRQVGGGLAALLGPSPSSFSWVGGINTLFSLV